MTTAKDEIAVALWQGVDPFADVRVDPDRVDYQGWGSDHGYLKMMVDELRPKTIVEIGVWKGASTITLAQRLRECAIDGVVVCVDTWLGSAEHWDVAEWFSSLRIEAGFPTIFKTFTSNIAAHGLENYVIPVPLDSANAAHLMKKRGVTPDLIHLDAAHDFESVSNDLRLWWPLIRPGGALIGDDYNQDGDVWPGVLKGFQTFFATDHIENEGNKCLVRKADDGSPIFGV